MLANFFANSTRTQYYDANNMDNVFEFTKYVVEPIKEGVCIPSDFNGGHSTTRFAASSLFSYVFILLLLLNTKLLSFIL